MLDWSKARSLIPEGYGIEFVLVEEPYKFGRMLQESARELGMGMYIPEREIRWTHELRP